MEIKPENLVGLFLQATLKPMMGTGEIRCRMKPGAALDMRTKAVHVTKAAGLIWQGQFHCHHLQQERYVVVSGAVAAVSLVGDLVSGNIYRAGSCFAFEPGVWHDILTSPDAEFVTIQVAAVGVDVEADREVCSEVPEAIIQQMILLYQAISPV